MFKNIKGVIRTTITFLAPLVALSPLAIIPINEKIQETKAEEIKKHPRFDGIEDYLYKTKWGAPITADISEPIKIKTVNASEQDIADIKETIKSFTEICPNIQYTLLSNKDYEVKQDITIYSDAQLESDIYGEIKFKYNANTATIDYPLNIKISHKVDNIYSDDGKTLFSFVLKHEMMHSLGFVDLYEDKYFNESIMYYEISSKTNISTFTELDINSLKQLYGSNKYAVVYRPNKIQLNYVKKENENEFDF